MLTSTGHRWRFGGAFLASAVLALSAAAVAPVAVAAGDAECRFGTCTVRGEIPGDPGDGDLTQPVQDPSAAEPTSNYCQEGWIHERGDCEQNVDPVRGCVWRLMQNQPAPPEGKDPTMGAWEECVPKLANPNDVLQRYPQRWWERSSGSQAVDPGQAALELVTNMQLEGIQIGMVPKGTDDEGVGAVGLPAWMWVENTEDPRAWGPYTVTKTVDGLVVKGTARPVQVTWDMGDGQQVVCKGPGTPYQRSYGKQESPDCGYTYMKMGDYRVTALTAWSVEWEAGGESGVIDTITRSGQPIKIGEFQALNVKP